ncbi:hypothetical protein PORY_002543 [Pneumocystis oryctolagi]|uniref:Uncharacterized protein n=1 Tax=Pneumocystis oryctolagi TaxID=42067 RepID=A0ACB7C9I6_9ASCO|nr:hypothetical protein PORY_002543 [Pneumocystis oryctolagi]
MALHSVSLDFSGITSLAACDDRLFAGSIDGSLYDLSFISQQEPEQSHNTLSSFLPFFSEKIGTFIEQVVYIDEANLIVCLVDTRVVLYNVSSQKIEGVLQSKSLKGQKIVNKTLNDVHETALGISSTSHLEMDGTVVSLLAVALKQRLVVYFWHDGVLSTETVEIALNQRVQTIMWINSTQLWLCFTSGYAFANLRTKSLSKPVSIKSFSALLRSLNLGSANINRIGLHTRSSKFLAVQISDHELLLSYQLKSIFVDDNGHPLKRKPITWDSEPTHLVYFHPHLIAAFDHQIRIHNIESYVLVQTFDITNITCIFSGKYLFISTQTQIWKFLNVPFDTQVNDLISQNRLDDALVLLNQINSVLFQNKTAKIRYIKMMKAYHLFNNGDYKNSMILYSESSAPPVIVIPLFPLEGFNCEQYVDDICISTYIRDSKMFLQTMHKKFNQLSETSDCPEIDLKEAAYALVSYYLNDARRKLSILISSVSQLQESFETLNEPLIPKYHFTLPDSDNSLTIEEMEKLLEIVDTTLFRAYMIVSPNLVGPLVRLQNKIEVAVAKDFLEKDKRYKDLVNFFFGRSLHKDALELLKKLGQGVISDCIHDEQFKGPSETINYLKKLNNDNIEEILLFIKWPLEADPDFAMKIFLNNDQQISKKKIYDFLQSFNEDLAIQYLEYLINELDENSQEFHNSLIMHYLRNIQKQKNIDSNLEKLLKLLINSEKYNLNYILEHLPKNDIFFEHKAIILSKLGQHKHVLEIYVFEMNNFRKAIEYCNKISSINNSELGDKIYLILLNILLKPPHGQEIQLSRAFELLSQYKSHINIETIISNLPLDIKISDLKLYLKGTIQNRVTDIMNGKIICSLQIASLIQYQNKLVDACNKRYIITPEKTCQSCHKRLGQSVLAILPNDFIVHYGCQRALLKTHNMSYTAK